MSKLVSILIPLYNAEKWVEATISSILDQSYENIELIIVDDGSTDESYELAKKFETDHRVKVYSQLNKGACAARNNAFLKSSGDYIVFFDADDLMHEDKIKNQIKLTYKYGDEYIYSSQWIPFKGTVSKNEIPAKTRIDRDFNNPVDWLIASWLNKAGAVGIWLTPREIIQKSGKWDEELKVNQDGEFFFRVLLNCKGVKFADNSYMYYRRDVLGSISNIDSKEKIKDRLKTYIEYEKVLLKEDSARVRMALANNYYKFIYIYYPFEKTLIQKAKNKIVKLNIKALPNVGSKRFKVISRLIGFFNALKLTRILR